jgi:DNA-directed RNA polymerase I, II, and III subunit RPABC1
MINNKQLDLLLTDENNNKIFVKYYLGKSLRPNNITDLVEDLFNLEEVLNKNDELLIISKDDINDSIRSTLVHLWDTNQTYVNIISINRLQFNILKHSFVPEHIILTTEEKNDVYKKYNITEDSKLPEISRFDPVSCLIGLRPNQLCRIIRPSKTAITSNYYRLCYNK